MLFNMAEVMLSSQILHVVIISNIYIYIYIYVYVYVYIYMYIYTYIYSEVGSSLVLYLCLNSYKYKWTCRTSLWNSEIHTACVIHTCTMLNQTRWWMQQFHMALQFSIAIVELQNFYNHFPINVARRRSLLS